MLAHPHKPVCSANTALPMLAGNGFDRMPAGLKTAIGGKTGNKGRVSGHCAVMWRRFRGARGEKRIRLTANGGGRDEKGRLFVLYSETRKTVRCPLRIHVKGCGLQTGFLKFFVVLENVLAIVLR